jgi:hypothetical protein
MVEIQPEIISIPKQVRKWIADRRVVLLVSGASSTLHVPFISHSFVCIFLHFPSFSFHLHPFSFHFAFKPFFSSFLKLWTWFYGLATGHLPQKRQTARDSQRHTERERKRSEKKLNEKERQRERGGAQASLMPNDMVTAGNRAPQVEFA